MQDYVACRNNNISCFKSKIFGKTKPFSVQTPNYCDSHCQTYLPIGRVYATVYASYFEAPVIILIQLEKYNSEPLEILCKIVDVSIWCIWNYQCTDKYPLYSAAHWCQATKLRSNLSWGVLRSTNCSPCLVLGPLFWFIKFSVQITSRVVHGRH